MDDHSSDPPPATLLARRARSRRVAKSRPALASLALLPCTCALSAGSPLPSPALSPVSSPPRPAPLPWLDPTALQVQPFQHHLDRRQESSSSINYPQPFDTTLSTNFTTLSCPSFIQTFVSTSDFQSCHPFSFLLGTSNAFFVSYSAASPSNSTSASFAMTPQVANAATLRQTLDASCAVDVETCSNVMTSLVAELQQSNRCGQDLAAGNAVAVEALQGFQNYEMMRNAACLKSNTTASSSSSRSSNSTGSSASASAAVASRASPSSSPNATRSNSTASRRSFELEPRGSSQMYCFEQAVASSDPDDLFFYYLPEGISLPSGTKPTCDACTDALMDIYACAPSSPARFFAEIDCLSADPRHRILRSPSSMYIHRQEQSRMLDAARRSQPFRRPTRRLLLRIPPIDPWS